MPPCNRRRLVSLRGFSAVEFARKSGGWHLEAGHTAFIGKTRNPGGYTIEWVSQEPMSQIGPDIAAEAGKDRVSR